MIYPEDFKTRVKKAYLNQEKLYQALDSGNVIVGRYLCKAVLPGISPDMILTATSLEVLQNQARIIKERTELYREWQKLYHAQNTN